MKPPKLPTAPKLPGGGPPRLATLAPARLPGAAPKLPGGPVATLAQRVRAKGPKDGVAKAQVELTETQAAFRENRKRERERFLDENDSEFWFCVFGVNRDQKEWMLRALGLWQDGDKYLDAETFWRAMRRLNPKLPPLPPANFKPMVEKKNARLAAISRPLPNDKG